MKLRSLVALLVMLPTALPSASAQEREATRTPTLAEYTSGSPSQLRPTSLRALQWLGDDYIYIQERNLILGTPGAKKAERTLLTQDELLALIGEGTKGNTAKYFSPFQVVGRDQRHLLITFSGKHYVLDPRTKQLTATFEQDTKREKTFDLAPTLEASAIIKDHNIYVTTSRGEEVQVTTDGSPTLVYGSSVHQNEFGIHGGLFWSPDGSQLAFYRMDQSMVAPYPIVHTNTRKATRQDLYYPMAGMPIHHVTVGVYNRTTGKTIYLNTGLPKEKYLTNITWSPEGKTIYIAEVNRQQNRMELKSYSAETGEPLQTLFVEENEKYIEPQHPLYFIPNRPNEFIWQTRRDGFSHLYRYTTSGKLLGQITKGDFEVISFLGFADGGKTLLYTSTEQSPINRVAYRIGIDGKGKKLLTPQPGWHIASASKSGKYLLDTFESLHDVRENRLVSTATGRDQRLYQSDDPEAGYITPEIILGTIKADDGKTDLHYRLIKPTNFDPTKKYPTIVYVYNGPHAQLVQNRFHAGSLGWDLYMATQGYVLFTVDGRGSDARGTAFEQVIHRHLGLHEMADQMRGVDFLKNLPYVDANRIGVYGWSYGGFMTTNLMLTHPETFKVGVAGGGVMDWSRYEAMYGERYMDTPQENPEGYKATNLALRAKDLQGRLLLIHGTIDPVVLWQHTQLFVEACVKAGTYPDYMIYPEHEHNVRGADRVHLNGVITRFFKDHL